MDRVWWAMKMRVMPCLGHAFFGIEAGRIQYAPAWPALEAPERRCYGRPSSSGCILAAAHHGGIAYQNVVAEQELGVMKESPLKVRFSSLLDGKHWIRCSGSIPLKTKLFRLPRPFPCRAEYPLKGAPDVPLSTPERTAVDLSARLQDATLSVKG